MTFLNPLDRLRALRDQTETRHIQEALIEEVPTAEAVATASTTPAASSITNGPNDAGLYACEIGPMMSPAEITYLQASFWDNGPQPKKGPKGNKSGAPRYKLGLEAWTVPADQIRKTKFGAQFKRFVQLRDAHSFLIKIVDKNRKTQKISEEYGRFLSEVVYLDSTDRNRDLFGVIFDRNGGWNYHEYQFVRVKFTEAGTPVAEVFLNEECLIIDTFHDKFADGLITHHAWLDYCGYNETRKGKAR